MSSLLRRKGEGEDDFYTKPDAENIEAFKLISVHIEPYRVRFVRNLEYLLQYTGMTTRQYKRRVTSCGVKNGIGAAYRIKNRNIQGFDMIHFAAMADVFKLPIDFLMGNIIQELVEDGVVVLEQYGIYRNKFLSKKTRTSSVQNMAIKPSPRTVNKRLTNPKMDQSSSPCGVFSILQFSQENY